jgi:uncharacterized pyridoxal phosphate-containing UPF0001 family protein
VTDLAQRLGEIRARIAQHARAAGRDPGAVKLLAVSKTQPPERVLEAVRVVDPGRSRVSPSGRA